MHRSPEVAAFLLMACAPVLASAAGGDGLRDWWTSGSALPSGSLREDLDNSGVSFSGDFNSYFFGNPVGGSTQSFSYVHSLYFQLQADLERIAGWRGATFVWSWADNAGSDLSQGIGNEFQVVGAYGPNSFYFDQLYLQQEIEISGGTLTAKAGQLTALNDFLNAGVCNYYINEAFQADVLRGINVLATYDPEASWGAFVKYDRTDWYVQSGIYQVSESIGDNNEHGLNYSFGAEDGTIVFLEGCWRPVWKGRSGNHQAYYKVGSFLSMWNYERYDGGASPVLAGFYGLGEQMLWRERTEGDEGLYAWGSFIASPQAELAQIPWFVSGGVQYQGLLPGRGGDRAVLGAAYGAFSMDQAALQKSEGVAPEYYEVALEASYWIAVNDWMTVTPDVQLILNPGGAHNIPDALVLGVAVGLSF